MKFKNFLIKLFLTWCAVSIPCTIMGMVYSIFGNNSDLCIYFYIPLISIIGFIILYGVVDFLFKIWKN